MPLWLLTALSVIDAEKQRAMEEYERKLREQSEMAQRRAGGSVPLAIMASDSGLVSQPVSLSNRATCSGMPMPPPRPAPEGPALPPPPPPRRDDDRRRRDDYDRRDRDRGGRSDDRDRGRSRHDDRDRYVPRVKPHVV